MALIKGEKAPLVSKQTIENEEQTVKLRIQNICCGKEAVLVKNTLNGFDGIISVNVNVIGRTAYVRHRPGSITVTEIVEKLNSLHLGVSIMERGQNSKKENAEAVRKIKIKTVSVTVQTFLFLSVIVATSKDYEWDQWVSIPILIVGGLPMLWKAVVQMKALVIANVNLLMLIAVGGTIALKEWLEGCLIIYVFSIADLLLSICYFKVEKTITDLLVSAPETAVLADNNKVVKVKDVKIGTLILVCAGEQIPLDGKVIKGKAAVDESSITGEAMPVRKESESLVYSGTIVQTGFLKIETTCDYSSSTLSRVSQYIEEAHARSSKAEEMLNKFAKYYTPIIVLTALLLFIIPFVLYKVKDMLTKDELEVWSVRALKVLVVACPCSLIIAVPVTMISGITNAAKNGLLIKGADQLEKVTSIKLVCFDKTGTLTEGRFQVVNEYVVDKSMRSVSMAFAAALETKSSHPVAAAIVNHYSGCITDKISEFGAQISLPEVTKFKNHDGMGLSGSVQDTTILVGNLALLEQHDVGVDVEAKNKLNEWSSIGCTVVFIAINKKLNLVLGLSDKVRTSSIHAIQGLENEHVDAVMLTGDNQGPAKLISEQIGLKEFHYSMKPKEKFEWLLRKQGDDGISIAMVGDGVNDCPSLAAADVGIAIGPTATGLAVSSAGITLMTDNLEKILYLLKLSKHCRVVVIQNIVSSLLIKIIFVGVAMVLNGMLWLAVLADVASLLFVVLNGIRPLYYSIDNLMISWDAEKGLRINNSNEV